MTSQTWARALVISGLLLDLLGAGVVAYGARLTPEQAGSIAAGRFAYDTDSENAKLPAAQNLLAQWKYARWGLLLVAIGFALQIAGAIVERATGRTAAARSESGPAQPLLLTLLVLGLAAFLAGIIWHRHALVTDAAAAAAWAQALAAALALVATVYLLRLTVQTLDVNRQVVGEMRRQNDQRELPFIVGSLEPRLHNYAKFTVTNVGGGHAHNVRLRLTSGDGERVWKHPLLQAGRSENFNLPGPQSAWRVERLAADGISIQASIDYEDEKRKPYHFASTVNVADLEWVAAAGWNAREPVGERLVTAVTELEKKLTQELAGVRVQLSRIGPEEHVEAADNDDAADVPPASEA